MKETSRRLPDITVSRSDQGRLLPAGANHLTVASTTRPPLRFQHHDADRTKAGFENASPVSVDVA